MFGVLVIRDGGPFFWVPIGIAYGIFIVAAWLLTAPTRQPYLSGEDWKVQIPSFLKRFRIIILTFDVNLTILFTIVAITQPERWLEILLTGLVILVFMQLAALILWRFAGAHLQRYGLEW